MDAETLSRVQFAFTTSFHFIFPPLSMGLGLMLVILGIIYVRTHDPKWRRLSFFWVKVYGLIFALGVATGVVQEFEFGMNWAEYSRFVGNVFGSLLAAEGVFAFFLEGGFLGLMLFGGNRLGPRLWLFSIFMVVFGAHFSALWILMANSWMQTPQGFTIVTDPAPTRAVMTDFWQVINTPSFIPRLMHVFMASWTVGAALMLSVSSWYILKKRHVEIAKSNLKVALPLFILFASVNVVIFGANQAVEVTQNQPLKLASMEGLYQSESCARMFIVGWVDEATQTTTGISIPCLLSFLAYQNVNATVAGIDSFAPAPTPPINLVFQVYHFMIVMGPALAAIGLLGGLMFAWRRRLYRVALRPVAASDHRLHRGGDHHRRLVDGRGRAPAVGGLQRAAHRERRVAVAHGGRRRLLARSVHRPLRAPARALPVPAQQEDPGRAGGARGRRDRRAGEPARHVPRHLQPPATSGVTEP